MQQTVYAVLVQGAVDIREPGQKLKQRLEKNTAYWLASSGLLSLPSCIIKGQLPSSGIVHRGLGTPTSVINHEITPQTCLRANLVEEISH